MTHVISPISFKISQLMRVTKLFKNPQWFGLPANPWVLEPHIESLGKRLKLVRKMHFQRISLTLTECVDLNLILSNGCLNLKETIP